MRKTVATAFAAALMLSTTGIATTASAESIYDGGGFGGGGGGFHNNGGAFANGYNGDRVVPGRGGGYRDRDHVRRDRRHHNNRRYHDRRGDWDGDDWDGAGVGLGILGGIAVAAIGSAIINNNAQPTYRDDHVARCSARYRSYDPRTDTYVTYGGEVRRCNL